MNKVQAPDTPALSQALTRLSRAREALRDAEQRWREDHGGRDEKSQGERAGGNGNRHPVTSGGGK